MKNLKLGALFISALFIGFPQAAGAAGMAPAKHVRGTVVSLAATVLTVSTASGPVKVPLSPKTAVLGVVPGSVSDIKPGTFIGTANVVGPSSSRALEVVVFPKAMAGTGEGDYPWDLPAGKSHSMMTNGTVASHGGSMMTNGTVSHAMNGNSKTVTLTYKGGTKTVVIPPGVPIVLIAPGSRALLTSGAHVVAFPTPSGLARAVIVGIKGTVPPM